MQELSFGRTAGVHAALYSQEPSTRTARKVRVPGSNAKAISPL
jgi:hypothetical protein